MPQTPEDIRAALQARIAAIESGSQDAAVREASQGGFGSSSVSPAASCDGEDGGGAKPAEPAVDAADEQQRAFRKIERLCLVREQASAQLRSRLARDGFGPEAIEGALRRALGCGLVDDGRFADVLVRSRLSQGKGRRGIVAELASLGIDADGVEALAAGDDGDEDEVARALALLERRPPRARNPRDAAYRRLVQKGFSSSAASSAARRWTEAEAEE